MNTQPLIIMPEDGVTKVSDPPKAKPGRPHDEHITRYVQQLCDMRVGQSCFFMGLTRRDVEFLRRPALAAGINLTIKEVTRDEIHLTAGVRIWREYGHYDDL